MDQRRGQVSLDALARDSTASSRYLHWCYADEEVALQRTPQKLNRIAALDELLGKQQQSRAVSTTVAGVVCQPVLG
jgi:hypothetical protein